MVHVPLITFRGVHGDLQLGAHLQHLHQARTHRLDATGHRGADATHLGSRAQHLREPLRHALADLLELPFAKTRELSPAVLRIPHDDVHLVEHLLPLFRQLVETVGLLHHDIRDIVAAATADIARAMTPVVGDIEGLLALRRRGKGFVDAVWIDIVVAGGIRGYLPDQIHHLGLSP